MMAWDRQGAFIVSKGENLDVKSLSPTGQWMPCFFVFDIVMLNDRVLTNVPLKVVFFFNYFWLAENNYSLPKLL